MFLPVFVLVRSEGDTVRVVGVVADGSCWFPGVFREGVGGCLEAVHTVRDISCEDGDWHTSTWKIDGTSLDWSEGAGGCESGAEERDIRWATVGNNPDRGRCCGSTGS